MCGITGIVALKSGGSLGPEQHEARLRNMVEVIRYRGPDQQGVWLEDGVGLGACRLKILDLSAAGAQPFTSGDGRYVLVHNGEVYNYRELRTEIGGKWRSDCDTEVIVEAYARFGPDCVHRFNGMFAFAIWDRRDKLLFCARDRVGIKPFYYATRGEEFLFGSEIKCLLATGFPAEANESVFYDYLTHGYYEHRPDTFFRGVMQLEPGHSLTVRGGSIATRRYWYLPERAAEHRANGCGAESMDAFVAHYAELVRDAVALRMRSDVPVGLHVSGGVDSTMLAFVARDVSNKAKLPLYSYAFGEAQYDETQYAEQVARALESPLEVSVLGPTDVPSLVETVLHHEEQPFPGVVTMAKHKLFRDFADRGITVVLGGHGGDEMAGGYVYYMGAYLLDLAAEAGYERALAELKAFAQAYGIEAADWAPFILRSLTYYLRGGVSADGTMAGFADGLAPDFVARARTEVTSFDRPFATNSLNLQYQDLRYTKLPRVLRNCDRASMAVGREKRVPFLDYRLVERAFATPTQWRIQDGVLRRYWREVARRFLPHQLLNLPKRPVVDPQRDWLHGPLAGWAADIIHSKSFCERGIFHAQRVAKEFARFRGQTRPVNSLAVWQWIVTELWFRRNVDGARD